MPQIADVMRLDFIEVAPEDTLGAIRKRAVDIHRVPLLCKGDDFVHTDVEPAVPHR